MELGTILALFLLALIFLWYAASDRDNDRRK